MLWTSTPIGTFKADGKTWELTSPFRAPGYVQGTWVCIKPGFQSDGASIPRILWTLVGPRFAPDTFPAALVHDALYASELLTQHHADKLFRTHLRSHGVGWLKSWSYYRAVRNFGGPVWRQHTFTSVKDARQYVHIA